MNWEIEMTENKDNDREPIGLRSSAVQEILGLVPNWMIRWGNTLILFLIIGVLVISYFVKYPTTITSEVTLTTTKHPENIYANVDGIFSGLNVKDGDEVASGEPLGTINIKGNETVLKTRFPGQVRFTGFWKIGQGVKQGDLLFRIIPERHGPYIGLLKIPMSQIEKIKSGQQVRIYLTENQMLKNAIIESTVVRIGSVPDENGLLSVEIEIGEKLITINDKNINYVPGMTGRAEVIVEELRLIERFFYQLRNIFKS